MGAMERVQQRKYGKGDLRKGQNRTRSIKELRQDWGLVSEGGRRREPRPGKKHCSRDTELLKAYLKAYEQTRAIIPRHRKLLKMLTNLPGLHSEFKANQGHVGRPCPLKRGLRMEPSGEALA